jgi:hypothetical protein
MGNAGLNNGTNRIDDDEDNRGRYLAYVLYLLWPVHV